MNHLHSDQALRQLVEVSRELNVPDLGQPDYFEVLQALQRTPRFRERSVVLEDEFLEGISQLPESDQTGRVEVFHCDVAKLQYGGVDVSERLRWKQLQMAVAQDEREIGMQQGPLDVFREIVGAGEPRTRVDNLHGTTGVVAGRGTTLRGNCA